MNHWIKPIRSSNEQRRVQNESPQDVPLWHTDYFELKTIEAQKAQDETLSPALPPQRI